MTDQMSKKLPVLTITGIVTKNGVPLVSTVELGGVRFADPSKKEHPTDDLIRVNNEYLAEALLEGSVPIKLTEAVIENGELCGYEQIYVAPERNVHRIVGQITSLSMNEGDESPKMTLKISEREKEYSVSSSADMSKVLSALMTGKFPVRVQALIRYSLHHDPIIQYVDIF